MRRIACAVASTILFFAGTSSSAWAFKGFAVQGSPGVNVPSIGLGVPSRVPCDTWESQTPFPFIGSQQDLAGLCPGDLSAQLSRVQARLLRRRDCTWTEGFATDGTYVQEARCLVHRRRPYHGWWFAHPGW